MCVIILKQPNVIIPFEKLESACIVNGDGWGMSIADRGHLIEQRGFKEEGNDPEEIAKLLEDAKDQHVMLHLRYATVGDKNLDNTHPFRVMNRQLDQIDVDFAHNGTLSSFKVPDSPYSDSHHFKERVVIPLLARSKTFMGADFVLTDPFIAEILKHYAGTVSIFSLIDGDGRSLIINQTNGVSFDGWWASNKYSFNATHRTSSQDWSTYSRWPNSTTTTKPAPWKPPAETKSFDAKTIDDKIRENELAAEAAIVEDRMTQLKDAPKPNIALVQELLKESRKTFCDHAGIDDLFEVCRMDQTDIAELVSFCPDMATLLIMDLLLELYIQEYEDDADQPLDAAAVH